MAEKRGNPVENRMSRRDSLESMTQHGKIVKPSERDSMSHMYNRKKKPKWKNPITLLKSALSGEK